jgi:hypothetical protein
MRDHAIALERDPASIRLTDEQVIDIHKMHLSGEPWDIIANRYGITRKNVQRIVQGRRHGKLHPRIAPALYEPRLTNEEVIDRVHGPEARKRYITNAINDFYGRDVFKDTPEALALAAHINSFLA